jgi:hypothetical protein
MTFARKLGETGSSNCFLTAYKTPEGKSFACVIRVQKQKVDLFKKKKHGDIYHVSEFGELLAVGLGGKFSVDTRKNFQKDHGIILPQNVTW